MEYLVEWVYELHGRSGGLGMGGIAPLSPVTIEAWARLMDIHDLEPHEVEGLLILDAALLSDTETNQEEPVKLKSSGPSWPTRKES